MLGFCELLEESGELKKSDGLKGRVLMQPDELKKSGELKRSDGLKIDGTEKRYSTEYISAHVEVCENGMCKSNAQKRSEAVDVSSISL